MPIGIIGVINQLIVDLDPSVIYGLTEHNEISYSGLFQATAGDFFVLDFTAPSTSGFTVGSSGWPSNFWIQKVG